MSSLKTKYIIALSVIIFFGSNGKEPVNFSADEVRYKREGKIEVVICKGNAEIVQGTSSVRAYLIKIYGKDRAFAKCYKNVIITDKKEEVIAKGDYAEYFSKKKYARISKNPKLYIEKNKLTIKSEIMERFLDEKRSIATGNFEFIQEGLQTQDILGRGERGILYEDMNKIVLEGDPSISVGEDKYFSDRIVFYPDEKRIKLLGNVRAEIEAERKKVETDSTNKETEKEL